MIKEKREIKRELKQLGVQTSIPRIVDEKANFSWDNFYHLARTEDKAILQVANQIVEKYIGKKNFLTQFLGAGMAGPAFKTRIGGVYKFTAEGTEAGVALAMGLLYKNLSTQARIFKVYELELNDQRFWIIDKELVEPISDYLEDEKASNIEGEIVDLLGSEYKSYDEFRKRMIDVGGEDGKTFKMLFNKKPKFMQTVFEFYKNLKKDEKTLQTRLADTHAGNIGMRGDRVLCFDCVYRGAAYSLKKGGKVGDLKSEIEKYLIKNHNADYYMAHEDKVNKEIANKFNIPVKRVEKIVSQKDFSPAKWAEKGGSMATGGIIKKGDVVEYNNEEWVYLSTNKDHIFLTNGSAMIELKSSEKNKFNKKKKAEHNYLVGVSNYIKEKGFWSNASVIGNNVVEYEYANKKQIDFLNNIKEKDLRYGVYEGGITNDWRDKKASNAYNKYGIRFEELVKEFTSLGDILYGMGGWEIKDHKNGYYGVYVTRYFISDGIIYRDKEPYLISSAQTKDEAYNYITKQKSMFYPAKGKKLIEGVLEDAGGDFYRIFNIPGFWINKKTFEVVLSDGSVTHKAKTLKDAILYIKNSYAMQYSSGGSMAIGGWVNQYFKKQDLYSIGFSDKQISNLMKILKGIKLTGKHNQWSSGGNNGHIAMQREDGKWILFHSANGDISLTDNKIKTEDDVYKAFWDDTATNYSLDGIDNDLFNQVSKIISDINEDKFISIMSSGGSMARGGKDMEDYYIEAEEKIKAMSDKEVAGFMQMPLRKYLVNKKKNRQEAISRMNESLLDDVREGMMLRAEADRELAKGGVTHDYEKLAKTNVWGLSADEIREIEEDGSFQTQGHWSFYSGGKDYEANYDDIYQHIFASLEDMMARKNEIDFYEYNTKLSEERRESVFINKEGKEREMAKGGMVKGKEKEAENLWNGWSYEQKMEFLQRELPFAELSPREFIRKFGHTRYDLADYFAHLSWNDPALAGVRGTVSEYISRTSFDELRKKFPFIGLEQGGSMATGGKIPSELSEEIKKIDWSYTYSDDNRWYQSGEAHRRTINKMIIDVLKDHPELYEKIKKEMWKEYLKKFRKDAGDIWGIDSTMEEALRATKNISGDKIKIYYVKGDSVVTNVSLSEKEAEEALENHNEYHAKRLGEGHIFAKDVPLEDWNDGRITPNNWIMWESKTYEEGGSFDYEKMQNDELQAAGFDVLKLTEAQKGVILMPSHAPENYMMDGEISRKQAFSIWKNRLANSGLSPADIKRAVNMHFKAHGGMTSHIKSKEHRNQ